MLEIKDHFVLGVVVHEAGLFATEAPQIMSGFPPLALPAAGRRGVLLAIGKSVPNGRRLGAPPALPRAGRSWPLATFSPGRGGGWRGKRY